MPNILVFLENDQTKVQDTIYACINFHDIVQINAPHAIPVL